MTKEQFGKIVMAIRTYYPRDNSLTGPQAIELWFSQLQGIPYEIMERAVNNFASKSKWPPTVADLKEAACDVQYGEISEWSKGWALVQEAAREVYSADAEKALRMIYEGEMPETFKLFDAVTLETVHRLGWKHLSNPEESRYMQESFRKTYDEIAERKRRERMTRVGTAICDGFCEGIEKH